MVLQSAHYCPYLYAKRHATAVFGLSHSRARITVHITTPSARPGDWRLVDPSLPLFASYRVRATRRSPMVLGNTSTANAVTAHGFTPIVRCFQYTLCDIFRISLPVLDSKMQTPAGGRRVRGNEDCCSCLKMSKRGRVKAILQSMPLGVLIWQTKKCSLRQPFTNSIHFKRHTDLATLINTPSISGFHLCNMESSRTERLQNLLHCIGYRLFQHVENRHGRCL